MPTAKGRAACCLVTPCKFAKIFSIPMNLVMFLDACEHCVRSLALPLTCNGAMMWESNLERSSTAMSWKPQATMVRAP